MHFKWLFTNLFNHVFKLNKALYSLIMWQFLQSSLILWHSKKQKSVAVSTAEAENIKLQSVLVAHKYCGLNNSFEILE